MFKKTIRKEIRKAEEKISDSFSAVMRTFNFIFDKMGYEVDVIDADVEEVALYVKKGYEIVDTREDSVLVVKKINKK